MATSYSFDLVEVVFIVEAWCNHCNDIVRQLRIQEHISIVITKGVFSQFQQTNDFSSSRRIYGNSN